MEEYSIKNIFNLIDLPHLDEFKNEYFITREQNNKQHIKNYFKYLILPENKDKNNKYLQFIFSSIKSKEYISQLVYLKYLEVCNFGKYYIQNKYSDDLHTINNHVNRYYNLPKLNHKIKDIVIYYENIDKSFAKYFKSIHCLLWMIDSYRNTEQDCEFNEFDKIKLNYLLTDELRQEILKEKTDEDNTHKEELERIYDIIEYFHYQPNSNKYNNILEKVFFTADWNFLDLSKIIYYIDKYDLDVYDVLNRLSADYAWAMYKVSPAQPGIQSTSIMILGDLGYSFDMNIDRTEDVQKMVDEIYKTTTDFYIEDFKKSLDVLINLFKRTVKKHLVWGATIF